jgi:hypothetical protein
VSEVSRIERELNQACREADLGSRNACIQTLRECEAEGASENDRCVAGMTPESDIRRQREDLEAKREEMTSIQEQIQAQQASIADLEEQALAINEEKVAARRALDESLAEIGNQRAETQRQLNSDLEQLEIAVDQAKDQLVTLELGFREFVLSKVDQCQEQAEQHRQETYNNYVQAAQRGRARYSQASLFRMTGMSVQEIARNQGRNMMNRCMRQRTSAREGNQMTPFGRRYQLERDKIAAQRRVLNREIGRMEEKVEEVQAANLQTLASISQAEAAQVANFQREVLVLNQRGAALVRQEQEALQRIENLQIESLGLMMDINNMENQLQRSHGDDIRIASDDTVEAYREAHQAADSLLSAARRAESGAERCNQLNFITGILEAFELADEAVARDVASPDAVLDVEVDAPTPTPAPAVTGAAAADDVTVSVGQTVN